MERDATSADLIVGVVGAGAMGRGIAQVAAFGGCRVLLFDAEEGAAVKARDFIETMLNRAVEKGRMTDDDAKASLARIDCVESIGDMASADAVVEAIVEDAEIKRRVFAEIEDTIAEDAVLATNTSSLSVTRLGATCRHPNRFAGFHFFNPVPLMRLVEVVSAVTTAPWVADFLVALGERMGREPVRVADAPGFLVNQVGRGYTIEAAHLVSEGICDFVDADRIMRDAAGFRMGPFELLDLTALDVSHPATVEIYEQSYHEPRFRPSSLMNARMQAGLLGRKTGQGFYDYPDGKQVVPAETPPPALSKGVPFWIDPTLEDAKHVLAEIVVTAGAEIDPCDTPMSHSVILLTPLGLDATTAARDLGVDPTRCAAVDPLFRFQGRRTIMPTPLTLEEVTAATHAMLGKDGTPVTVIADSPGFVAQRIISMIVNIGAQVAERGIASPGDIDRAVILGLNYPQGPLGFADKLGPWRMLKIAENLQRVTGDPRYRPAGWLRRRAQLGISAADPGC